MWVLLQNIEKYCTECITKIMRELFITFKSYEIIILHLHRLLGFVEALPEA